ncbi:hypothetical protein P8C59_005037 [Phyllachora maydis]|uniref:R3H-associated N-terminal domain-containing protein n=1 Tax=Phyllachora maydis TaxID=1825666 RepID=A0AAD9I5C1_9PEZI|nr:hypothetical protein P8C59_005037 [Phyllachora maydis]
MLAGHSQNASLGSTAPVDIEAWTVSALQALSIAPTARGTGAPLSIPLDEHHDDSRLRVDRCGVGPARMKLRQVTMDGDAVDAAGTPPRRPPSRRDSMRRREALLKGNEGSRQRRRWENDRLLHVPNVEPPHPDDWLPRPTHPVTHVPYHVAQYWDRGVRERVEERKAADATYRKKPVPGLHVPAGPAVTGPRAEVGKVPRVLHTKAKRTPAVKSWLRGLEEPVRQYLVESGAVAKRADGCHSSDERDSEDDEIVFVGRNGGMYEGGRAWKQARRQVANKPAEAGMVLEASGDDESAAFKRWLTHSISDYYGLDSKSVTLTNPTRRVVYLGMTSLTSRLSLPIFSQLPPPLWQMF